MEDVIRLLPESLANQIAAGEVVQRPASAVKELLENAVDAGARHVELIVRDSGKALVQVVDDGQGMSETDARMAFERHATSKLADSEGLFSIRTFGFRGEALASIAAVAQVELKTRRKADEVGVRLLVEGSEVVEQEPCQCPPGTSIAVKNLFFNVPARRNFLKSGPVEFKHVAEEFQRVALANPGIDMKLTHNGQTVHHLKSSNLAKRIVNLFDKGYQSQLVFCEERVPLASVSGYVGKPETAKKSRGEQYFFANGRFIKHPYLHHAVMNAYDRLIEDGKHPFYCLFVELDPKRIDVNVHPTKTEVKFDDERTIYALIRAAVRQSLAQHNVASSLDFSADVNFGRLPEETGEPTPKPSYSGPPSKPETGRERSNKKNWEQLYGMPGSKADWQASFEADDLPEVEPDAPQELTFSSAANEEPPSEEGPARASAEAEAPVFQIRDRYVVSPVKSGMLLLDQRAAFERIYYEQYLSALESGGSASQRLLFPETLRLPPADFALLFEIKEELEKIGFQYESLGGNALAVNGLPPDLSEAPARELIEGFLEQFQSSEGALRAEPRENVARSLARRAAARSVRKLDAQEMRGLIDRLFACSNPNYAPDGKKALALLKAERLAELLG